MLKQVYFDNNNYLIANLFDLIHAWRDPQL